MVTVAQGERIRKMREDAGVSLDQFAELVDMEPHVLSGVEAGWRGLSARQWSRMVRCLESLPKPAAIPGAARPPMPRSE